jgi:import inner membrane translocase subunit TIM10
MAGELSSNQLQVAGELEIEMMQDLYKRMTTACHKKCVVPRYKDSELSKGESVCIDRCVAKYMEVHDRIGKQLTTLTLQQQPTLQNQQINDPSRVVGSYP